MRGRLLWSCLLGSSGPLPSSLEGGSHFDAAAYWEKRHRAHGTALTGVGHIELSAAQNAADYDVKLSRVVAALERAVGSLADKKTLDAGCGIGLLTERLAQRGGAVTAVDLSATAIATARQRTSAAVTYHCIPLDAMTWEAQFDCVVCMDVCSMWSMTSMAKGLARLVAAAKPGAPILIKRCLARPASVMQFMSAGAASI